LSIFLVSPEVVVVETQVELLVGVGGRGLGLVGPEQEA